MKVDVPIGKYVVAVSGGVDSAVLLDLLTKQSGLELVVAHVDHGMREDSAADRKFVEDLAKKHKLPFEFVEARLGSKASEAQARKVRYEFLEKVRVKYAANKIVTAHHQDDVLETMLINIVRGTGRKGLSSLSDTAHVLRPLVPYSKAEIITYAKTHNLDWREDPSNNDTKYLRNYLRKNVMPKLSQKQKQQLLATNAKMKSTNQELDELLNMFVAKDLDKKIVANLSHAQALEVMAHWLRQNGVSDFDRKTLDRLVIGAKTLPSGKSIEVKRDIKVRLSADKLELLLYNTHDHGQEAF